LAASVAESRERATRWTCGASASAIHYFHGFWHFCVSQPLLLIGRLAVDAQWQARGLGSALLVDALRRCLAASEIAGATGVVAHTIDEAAVGFYQGHGFVRCPLGDRVMLWPIETVRSLIVGAR
jgi:GNAT superfamily N-acetyltransferase